MVLFKFYLIFLLFNSSFCLSTVEKDEIEISKISKCVNSIISTFFIKYGLASVRIRVTNPKNFLEQDVSNEIIKHVNGIRYYVKGASRNVKMFNKRRSPTIIAIDSYQDFNLVKEIILKERPKFYLLILLRGISDNVKEIASAFWKTFISDVNFLAKNGEEFSIYSFFPFDDGRCGDNLNFKVVNTYNPKNNSWTSSNFYPDKFHDLNHCKLKVGVREFPPMTTVEKLSDGSKFFGGVEIKLLNELSHHINFNPDLELSSVPIGRIFSNGTANGLLSVLHEKKKDMIVGSISLQWDRVTFLSPTSYSASIAIVLVIPQPKSISPFQKLVMPLDIITWCLIASMFLITILISLSRKKCSNFYRRIVGKNINYPVLNMTIAITGGSQIKLPQENISRFVLANFLIFCVVIKGIYQGKLFDIMQKDLHEKEIETIDDLIKENLVFHTYDSLADRIEGFKFADRVNIIQLTEMEEYRQKTLDPFFNGIVFSNEAQVIYTNYINRFNFSYLICKERLVNNQIVFYLSKNHYLTDKFNEKIIAFREFGVINHLFSEFVDFEFRQKIGDKCEPISFHDVSAIFGVWCAGLGVSIAVWIFECIFHLYAPNNNTKHSSNIN